MPLSCGPVRKLLTFALLLATAESSQLRSSVGRVMGDREDDTFDGKASCQMIKAGVCKDLPYNMTFFPNLVGLSTQTEATRRVASYRELINMNCSKYIRVFLCSVYFPMCNSKASPVMPLKPCMEFCQHVKGHCEVYLRMADLRWPKDLACSAFPSKTELCLLPKTLDDDVKRKWTPEQLKELNNSKQIKAAPGIFYPISPEQRPEVIRPVVVNITCSAAEVRIASEPNSTCLTRCMANVLFTSLDKRFAEAWTTVWAVCCLLSSLLTVITYAADSGRFRYPERPIVYLCVCYLFYSLTYIIRAAVGSSAISCRELDRTSDRFLIRGGHEGTWCTITFLINYFFMMASCLWWVILTLAWFLSAAKKWGHEGVEAVSSLFHMVAWGAPAIGTIIILIMHKIDGDELTGMCFVGSQDPNALLIFVLVPMCVMLVVGLIFLMFGFGSLLGVRKDLKMKEEGAAANIRR